METTTPVTQLPPIFESTPKKFPVYVLAAKFGEDFRVLNISYNLEALTRQMKKIAIDAICDEIGKNNFVDTLDSQEFKSKPEKECPAGFVIKYGQQSGSTVRVLNVSKNTQYTSMFLRKYVSNEPIGKYLIIESAECDVELSSAKTSGITTADSMPVVIKHAHSDLMVELAKKLTERRSRLGLDDSYTVSGKILAEGAESTGFKNQEIAIDINGNGSILLMNEEGVSFVDATGNETSVVDCGDNISEEQQNLFVCSTDASYFGQKNASLEYIVGDIINGEVVEQPLINL